MHNRISLEQKSKRQKKRAKDRILQTCAIEKVKNTCNCSLTKKILPSPPFPPPFRSWGGLKGKSNYGIGKKKTIWSSAQFGAQNA